MKTLKAFETGDGAHCGLADWYEDKEKALRAALKRKTPWTTGWYGSKKEIASARITSDGQSITVEVSVSDDFGTPGMASRTGVKCSIEAIREALWNAWDEADADRNNNETYAGYSVYHWTRQVPEWRRAKNVYPRERRKLYPRKRRQCLDYYLVDAHGGMDGPPGDSYYWWGWQNSEDEGQTQTTGIPKRTAERLADHARSFQKTSLRIGDWEIAPWDEEDES